MPDQVRGQMRVLDIDTVRPVGTFPPVAPAMELGPRPVMVDSGPPLPLADPRSFQIELGSPPVLEADSSAAQQGKHRR